MAVGRFRFLSVVTSLMVGGAAALGSVPLPPAAPMRAVVDDYFGTKVVDPYRWMEDRASPEFLAWAKAQDDYTRAVLAGIPGRDALRKRIAALDAGGTLVRTLQVAPRTIVYQKRGPDEEVYKLYARAGFADPERLLLDPNAAAPAGKHFSIDYLQLSPDGSHVVVGVSEGGSEESVIRVIETASGKSLPERIDRTEYGSPSWRPDGRAFFYNRFTAPPAGAPETAKYLNSRAYLHVLGQAASQDAVVLGVGLAKAVSMTPVDFPIVLTAPGSTQAVAVINHGATPELTLYVAPAGAVQGAQVPWRKLADVDDAITNVALHGDDLYLLSHKDASRYKIIRVKAAHPELARAEVVVPASNVVIEDFAVAQDALYFRVLDAGVQRIRRSPFSGHGVSELGNSLAGGIAELSASPLLPGLAFPLMTWLTPPHWYRFDPATGAYNTGLVPSWALDTSAYEVNEVQVKARDGTAIPLSIIQRRGLVKDGSHPTWLTGYGAYGISLTPHFVPAWLALLERGGVVAVAHVRGGGEFGEDWHLAGKLATKPNTYRDLIDCAEYLVSERYTAASELAIQGGSAGGITVGMAMTERPDLFRVVLSDVGDSNALRAEFETDGDANSLEYGSVKNPDGFRALLAVDAVQHVRDGVAYPAVLLTTGINDPRVAPWMPAKMTARLQAANPGGRPVLLRVDYDAGHGFGSTRTQRDELFADQLSFMLWQTGDPDFQQVKK
jgi:prolyl oligopeptidase